VFDKKTMEEMARSVKNMSPKERQKRAKSLKKLMDTELKKRKVVELAAYKKKGHVFEWLSSLWKDD